MLTKTKGAKMKTHVIDEDGNQTTIEGKITDLKKMQEIVKGYIEIVNTPIHPKCTAVMGAENLQEMVVNEEGLLRPDFGVNHRAREIIADGYGVHVDEIQVIKGPVFITDGWRVL